MRSTLWAAIFRAMLLGVFERAWRVRAQVYNEAKRNKREERKREREKLSTTRVTRHNARSGSASQFFLGLGISGWGGSFFFSNERS